jgi:molecular chaperone Hsp33
VFVEASGGVGAAGGYMVQLLPGSENGLGERLEATIRALPHPTTMLREGDSPERMLDRIFGTGEYDVLARTPVRFECPCSRDRAERAVMLLGDGPIRELIEQANTTGYTELSCEFCREIYRLSANDLELLRDRSHAAN